MKTTRRFNLSSDSSYFFESDIWALDAEQCAYEFEFVTPQSVPSDTELASALAVTNFLSEADIKRRAGILFRDLTRFQIEGFRLLPVQVYPASPSRPEIRVAEYEFGPVSFSLENAKDPASIRKTVEEMAGTTINREDILYLSQVCEMAHRLIPDLWLNDPKLIEDVRLSSKHLDTLNEVWWIGRWDGLSEKFLQREVTVLPGSRKTVDWRFRLPVADREWTINLEVKRIIGSIDARAYRRDHHFYTTLRADGSRNRNDPREKFQRSADYEVNVLAVTWFDEISVELETEIQRFLDEDDRIDVVIVWASGDRRRGGWVRFFPRFRDIPEKRGIVSSVLVEPNEEDKARIIAFIFPRTLESIRNEMSGS
jgi:hypothetical protein